MRILLALTYYRPHYSGLTIYAERQARALAARGHQVTILTSRFDPTLPARETCDGVEVVRPKVWFHISKGVIMPTMPYWAWKLARQADVVNLHVPQLDAAPIAVISRMLGKPVAMTYHCDLRLPSGPVHRLANSASNLANHITARSAGVIVHNSQDYAEHSLFLRRYLDKAVPLYPPVEVAPASEAERAAFLRKQDIQPGQRIIGMVARLASEKGVEYLAQAMPQVLQRFPEARVLYVGPYQNVLGEESYAARVLELIEPIRDHWSFLGVVPPADLTAFYHTAEVVVSPSLNSTESFGLAQVEAITCGAPVVVSDLPGVRVPVQKTGMGRIVPPGNAGELAQAIIAILEQPRHYHGQTDTLLRLSTPQAVAEQYETIFKRLLAPQPARIKEDSLPTRGVGTRNAERGNENTPRYDI